MKIFLILSLISVAILAFTLGRLWELSHADFTMTQDQAAALIHGGYSEPSVRHYPKPLILEN